MTAPQCPSPGDYPTREAWLAAYKRFDADRTKWDDARRLRELAAIGARTAPCPHGYGPFDSAPCCD